MSRRLFSIIEGKREKSKPCFLVGPLFLFRKNFEICQKSYRQRQFAQNNLLNLATLLKENSGEQDF